MTSQNIPQMLIRSISSKEERDRFTFGINQFQSSAGTDLTCFTGFQIRTRASKVLTDRERLSLALMILNQPSESLLTWELRLFIDTDAVKYKDCLTALTVIQPSIQVARYRLLNLGPRWEEFLDRNVHQNVQSAFKKINLVFLDTGKVIKPERKLGYTDGKGNVTDYQRKTSRALRDARPHWLDREIQHQQYCQRQDFIDVLALITGFSD